MLLLSPIILRLYNPILRRESTSIYSSASLVLNSTSFNRDVQSLLRVCGRAAAVKHLIPAAPGLRYEVQESKESRLYSNQTALHQLAGHYVA